MDKTWDELTNSEKAQVLRDDLDGLISFVDGISMKLGQINRRIAALEAKAE